MQIKFGTCPLLPLKVSDLMTAFAALTPYSTSFTIQPDMAASTQPSDAPSATHHTKLFLPTELWLMVFRSLSLFDLLCCQRVCRTWSECIPGNDVTLRETLFLQADKTRGEDLIQCLVGYGIFPEQNNFGLDIEMSTNELHWPFQLHPFLADLGKSSHFVHRALKGHRSEIFELPLLAQV